VVVVRFQLISFAEFYQWLFNVEQCCVADTAKPCRLRHSGASVHCCGRTNCWGWHTHWPVQMPVCYQLLELCRWPPGINCFCPQQCRVWKISSANTASVTAGELLMLTMLVYAKRWIMDSRLVNDYQLVLGYWPSLWIVAKQLDRWRWHLANSLGQVVTSWLDSDWYTIATALSPLWGMHIIVVVSNVVLEAAALRQFFACLGLSSAT